MKKLLALLIIFLMVISTFSMFIPQTMGGASIAAGPTAYLTDFVQLTTNPQADYDPSWSPDGSKIVWRAYDSSGWYRHVSDMNADGSNKRQLTFGSVIDEMPDYSPDGTKIVFVRYVRNIYTQDIMIMNADGSNLQQITSSGLGRQFPRWSNNGNKIVFYYGGAGTDIHEIHIMNSDGTDEIALVTGLPAASRGHWSPDDKYIVYDRPDGVWVVGTSPPYEKRQVYATTQGVYSSIFSPDGKYILFQTAGNLHLIDANGNYIAQLTSDGLLESPHDWSPNGKYIAFSSRKSGNYDIWKARIVIGAPPLAPEFTYDIHSVFDDYSDLRLALEYIFQKGVPFGKIVDCVITITVKDPNQVRSVSVIINGGIHNAEQLSLGVYKVFYYLARNDAAKIIWTMISAIIKLPLPGITVTVPTPILKQIIIEDINFQKHYHAIDKRLPTIEDAILRLWWWQPRGQYILAASSVDILIIDSKGRKVGAIYENGVFVKEVVEIYGAYYSGRDTVPKFAFIPSTEDVHVSIYSVSKDQYELFVIKEDKGSITFSKSTGKVSIQNEIHEYRVTSTDVELYKKQLLTPSVPFDSLLYGLIAVGTGVAIAGIAIAIAITKRRKP